MELKDIKTAEDLKGLPKGVYDHILTVAGESVRQQVEADHAKKQAETVDQKIEAAIKPLKEQIVALTTERDKLQAGLSKVVESLVAADLVEDREPADAEKELRGKMESLQVKRDNLVKERDALKLQVESAGKEQPKPEIDGEQRAKETLTDTGWKQMVVESMRGSKFKDEESFKRAVEQTSGIAQRAFEAGRGIVKDPDAETTPADTDLEKRKAELRRLSGIK